MIFQEGRMMKIRNKLLTGETFATYLIPRESKQNTYPINFGLMVCKSTIPIFLDTKNLGILLLGMNPVTRIQKPLPVKDIN